MFVPVDTASPSGPGFGFDAIRLLREGAQLLIAFALALPTGWERERADHSAGVRTFPIVALASCGYIILARALFPFGADAHAHVLQGLITGIGFIGGGAIVKDEQRVRGTATAASIWATSAIGGAVGYGQLELAVLIAFITYLTLRFAARYVIVAPLERPALEPPPASGISR